MVRMGAAAAALLLLPAAVSAAALELRAGALVEAKAASWKPVPSAAVVDAGRLSFKRKAFLEGSFSMPVRAKEVRRALATALRGMAPEERRSTARILEAVEKWASASLFTDPAPSSCPASWRPASRVIGEGKGNPFELVRAVTAVLRAAGVPARPVFNGLPLVCIYVTPARGSGFWTVWDPFHPSASAMRLPVAWLPPDAGEVPLVSTKPAVSPCAVTARVLRFPTKEAAEAAFAAFKATGSPEGEPQGLSGDATEWWEVWTIGAAFDPEPAGGFTVEFPLPFVIDDASRCGTREHALWISDPSRLEGVPRMHSRTDQDKGGLLVTLRARVRGRAGGG